MKRLASLLLPLVFGAAAFAQAASPNWVRETMQPGDFPLVQGSRAVDLVIAPDDYKVVALAAADLAADIERVSGRKPVVRTGAPRAGEAVFIGTLGHALLIDALVRAGKLDVGDLRGQWESFVIATVVNPFPGVPSALAIVGSDRRGTAFGVYELSQAVGVSPWYWWADVAPVKKAQLFVASGTRRFGPPSVKYRGIFINDEDWGLVPWAAKTFEPEAGNLGPRTYAKIFELMLRLKANTVWPGMHPTTKPFNAIPENAPLADDYAIVMGSSHAEPMLRNNVGEWPHERDADYNYITNRDGVRAYWEERVRANGRFENSYTLGMRGIHDSNMQGPKTDAERIATLEQIFADQRAMLAQSAAPVGRVVPNAPLQDDRSPKERRLGDKPPYLSEPSQIFCAYKEVLGLYRQGLRVPDDVTIVWPDDNHGYIRNFATAEEQKRPGGFGVYYHLSYLGAPMAYLWLYTTPPALVWEEMTKAYDHGARTIWIANVGDLKPAEIGTEFFLQLAWDVNRYTRENLPDFFRDWAAREFGREHAEEIAPILRDYFQLNYQRRPEHLQWWLPRETPRPSALTTDEALARLRAFADLRGRADAVAKRLRPEQADAFFELVGYPVAGSALANERFFAGEQSARIGEPEKARWLARAQSADTGLRQLTEHYNNGVAGGKWRGLMNVEPADDQWKSFRLVRWQPPKDHIAADEPPKVHAIAKEAEHFTRKTARGGASWEIVPGLGRTGEGSVAVFPTTMASIASDKLATEAPRLDYDLAFDAAGNFPVSFYVIPTQALAGDALRFAFALDDAPPQVVSLKINDGGAEWAHGVLDATRVATATLSVTSPGAHTLRLYAVDAGVVVDKLAIDLGGTTPSYLGPPENSSSP